MSTKNNYSLIIAFFASFIICTFHTFFTEIVFSNDSVAYIENGRKFLFLEGSTYQYWRTPLVSLIFLFTGVSFGITFKIYIFLCYVLGVSMPLLVYYSISPLNRWAACFASLLVTLSLVAFAQLLFIMTFHIYIFFLCLTLFLFIKVLTNKEDKKINYILLMGLSCFLTEMSRPHGSYLFILYYFFTIDFKNLKFMKKWLLSLIIFLFLHYSYISFRPLFISKINGGNETTFINIDLTHGLPSDETLLKSALFHLQNNNYNDAITIKKLLKNKSEIDKLDSIIIDRYIANNDFINAINYLNNIDDKTVLSYNYNKLRNFLYGDKKEKITMNIFIELNNLKYKFDLKELDLKYPAHFSNYYKNNTNLIISKTFLYGYDLTNTSYKMIFFPVFNSHKKICDFGPKYFFYNDPNTVRTSFYDKYLDRLNFTACSKPNFDINNGPATQLLFELIDAYWFGHSDLTKYYSEFNEYKNKHSAAYITMNLFHQVEQAHWTVWQLLDDMVGPDQANKLLALVYREYLANVENRELLYYYYFINFMNPFINNFLSFPSHPFIESKYDGLNFELRNQLLYPSNFSLSKLSSNIYVKPYFDIIFVTIPEIFFLISFLAIFIVWNNILYRKICLLCLGVITHQLLTSSITAGTSYAYNSQIYIFTSTIIGILLCSILQLRIWRKKTISHGI